MIPQNGNGSFHALARECLAAGMCVVPAGKNKAPALNIWTDFQKGLPVADEVDEWFGDAHRHPHGIGFICGLVSGGLEVLDFDAKYDSTGTLNDRALAAIRQFSPGLLERLVIERTPSGGLHLYYRCEKPMKNAKLAWGVHTDGKRMAVVETRGEGGFIVGSPTPGYSLTQGSLAAVPTITEDEHSALLAAARSLDTAPQAAPPPEPVAPKRARTDFPAGFIPPGDAYDQTDDWMNVAKAHGWTTRNNKFWSRPGKTDGGTSATWDTLPDLPRHFYVFSPNAAPLEDGKTYKPWSIFAHLECGGDFIRAAEKLYEMGFGTRKKAKPGPVIESDAQAAIDAENEQRMAAESGGNGGTPSVQSATGTPLLGSDWPEPVPADELCANPPPTPPELIEGILYDGGTMLLSGPSKSHKTFSALDVGISIADGTPWLGHKTTQSKVLYLNLELRNFATPARVSKICAARGSKPHGNLVIWNLRGKTITLAALTVQLPLMIRKFGCRVVCIDPHYKVSSVSDMEENSNDSQGKLLTLMEGLCAADGCALILTHHFAKGDASAKNAIDRASGGGVFARWGDVMLTFTPHEEDDAMTVEMALRDFAPVKPFVVRWEYPRWTRDSQLDPASLKSNRGAKEQHTAESALRALGTELMTYSEWLKASGMSESTFRRKREELVAAKKVEFSMNCYRAVK